MLVDEVPLDIMGREINVGDYIAFGHIDGSSSGIIRFGKIVKITPIQLGQAMFFDFFVMGVIDQGGGTYHTYKRPGRMGFPGRVMVVDRVPEPIRVILEACNVKS